MPLLLLLFFVAAFSPGVKCAKTMSKFERQVLCVKNDGHNWFWPSWNRLFGNKAPKESEWKDCKSSFPISCLSFKKSVFANVCVCVCLSRCWKGWRENIRRCFGANGGDWPRVWEVLPTWPSQEQYTQFNRLMFPCFIDWLILINHVCCL